MDKIAYEYLDIHTGAAPSPLDTAHTADRIARHRRGGWCFQLCGAFASLLTSLGFDVSMHRATVRHSPDEVGAGPPVESSRAALDELNHLAVLVHFDRGTPEASSYLADVGLGDYAFSAMRLEDGPYEEPPFRYAIERTGYGWRFRECTTVC